MLLTSILRTIVPALWGALIAWVIGFAPILSPLEAHLLGVADVILPILTAVIIAAWYAFWRWLEPRLPAWLTRAVLGSAQSPTYGRQTPPAPEEATALLSVADALDRTPGPDHRA